MQKFFQGRSLQWSGLLKLKVVCISVLFCLPAISFASNEHRVLAVKTAYLFRLALFVDWPEARSETFMVCIADNEAYATRMQRILAHHDIQGRTIHVKNIKKESDLSVCQVLYISAYTDNMNAFLIKARGKPILTLGESKAFYHEQGMIYLYIKQNKIKFYINMDAVNFSGLRVRGQLMALSEDPY